MNEQKNSIDELHLRLETLAKKQQEFSKEILALRSELFALSKTQRVSGAEIAEKIDTDTTLVGAVPTLSHTTDAPVLQPLTQTNKTSPPPAGWKKEIAWSGTRLNLEKFIGENLINKIGIAITVIGVAIGAKYSFDHELISPLMRILLGYLMGLSLLVVGFRLKKNYHNYSAVLVSGSIAILYFITYFAYEYYQLLPLTVTFGMMVGFTVFAVVTALNYDRQVIAHIGMVGAYAVPFLLAEDSGRVWIMFAYMTLLNIGILIIALQKYWKPLYYVSFAVTWSIFSGWYFSQYLEASHFTLALSFLTVYFVIFYTIFLAYKLLKQEKFEQLDVVLLLSNSFIFYGIGYAILSNHPAGSQILGLFSLGHAGIHAAVATLIFTQKQADRNVFYLIAGLALVFVTIAIPVQLDGNWVTLLWVCEAALLFWIGRNKQISLYEGLSYPLMVLSFLSIYQDWAQHFQLFGNSETVPGNLPLLNVHFLTGILFVGCFAIINYLQYRVPQKAPIPYVDGFGPLLRFAIPAILLVVLYMTFFVEIMGHFNRLYFDTELQLAPDANGYIRKIHNTDLHAFRNVWMILYSIVFTSLVILFNVRWVKSPQLGTIMLALSTVFLLILFTLGFADLAELRNSYLHPEPDAHFPASVFHLAIRYVAYLTAGLGLWAMFTALQQDFQKQSATNLLPAYEIVFFISCLWMASSELLHWMSIWEYSKSDKLGLSILWGIFALGAIAWGIWKGKRHVRIAAIVLFSVTLIKLFLYDISHLNTLAKTVVFVSLGLLLLVISFLYNKYKHLIADDDTP